MYKSSARAITIALGLGFGVATAQTAGIPNGLSGPGGTETFSPAPTGPTPDVGISGQMRATPATRATSGVPVTGGHARHHAKRRSGN